MQNNMLTKYADIFGDKLIVLSLLDMIIMEQKKLKAEIFRETKIKEINLN